MASPYDLSGLKEFDINAIRKQMAISTVLSKNGINGNVGPGGKIMDFLGYHFGSKKKKKQARSKKKHARSKKKQARSKKKL